MKCKFCGCTDEHGCVIGMFWAPLPDVRELQLMFDDTRYPAIAGAGTIATIRTPCHWSAPNICSAPACIERAYPEACAMVDELIAREFAA